MEKQEEEANIEAQRLYLNHLSRMYAKPKSKEEAKANEKFIKAISPKGVKKNDGFNGPKLVNSDKPLEWDSIEKLKRLEGR
ncbi:hypothetical protein ACFP67_14260 [Mammaliicoccus sciuri]|uniref:hypothetical protein n=1 Tax=Mammaliicoccus sciuri TaxID=1296 RepID=UPI000CD074E3|nr:hypothetical protein [Mammaliicoccus sciuri]PNZ29971.1 hypothetical protein CD114_01060 [Mammaliicoccus sciuri]